MASEPRRVARTTRARMTATQRREQLLVVSRGLFAEKGFEGTSVEEIAARAEVSKPVVYEHFGGKEGIYAVVVDREIQALTAALSGALESGGHPKVMVERSALALLGYIEDSEDGFRILVRDSPVAQATGTFSSLIGDVATQVEHLLAEQFTRQDLDPRTAPIYAQMLVGMVALTGQYWLDARSPKKADVAAHLVNLAWNGLSGLERRPRLSTAPATGSASGTARRRTASTTPTASGTPPTTAAPATGTSTAAPTATVPAATSPATPGPATTDADPAA